MCLKGRDGACYPAHPQRPGKAKGDWHGKVTAESVMLLQALWPVSVNEKKLNTLLSRPTLKPKKTEEGGHLRGASWHPPCQLLLFCLPLAGALP